jgi:hypothetical protein
MAFLTGSYQGSGTIRWEIGGLEHSPIEYEYLRVETNDGKSKQWHDSTNWDTTTGHATGITVHGTAWAKYSGTLYYAGETDVVIPGSSPPSGTPSVNASALTGHQLSISWTSVSGATGYDIYADGFYKTSSSGNSATISIDKEYWNYSIAVYPYNSAGTGSAGTTSCISRDETPPSVSSLTKGTVTSTSVNVTASGYDNSPSSGNSSGLSGFFFYKNGVSQGTSFQSGGSASFLYTGLTPGGTYTFSCQAFDVAGNYSSVFTLTPDVTTPSRPSKFKWTGDIMDSSGNIISNSKVFGGTITNYSNKPAPVSASDWMAFQNKINEFRVYKLWPSFSFTTPVQGGSYTPAQFLAFINEARSAISAMTPPTPVPPQPTKLSAAIFNDLRDSLNSIT